MEASGDGAGAKTTNSVAKRRGKITQSFDRVTFNSDFDSGNLDRVEQWPSEDGLGTLEYRLWTAPDCAGTDYENTNRSWFYFSVTTCAGITARTIRMHIMNLNKQSRLYQQGMTPMMKIVPGRAGWERMRDRPEWENTENGMKLSFQYNIPEGRKLTVYFAFCYPYSYGECQRYLNKLEQHLHVHNPDMAAMGQREKEEVYYHRELLCHSLDGLRVDLITISSHEGILAQEETRLPHLFPNVSEERARRFSGKKVIMISSRVHPGETPSSFVFNGFLNFLLRPDDPRAVSLRKHFVFKLIPMLNPDGVARGHYRTDSRGVNLNRFYIDPHSDLHPSVYAARSLLMYHHSNNQQESDEEPKSADKDKDKEHSWLRGYSRSASSSHKKIKIGYSTHSSCTDHLSCSDNAWPSDPVTATYSSGVALYVDLHAHASKRGCFMYGNYFKEESIQAECMLLPYLISANSVHFDFDHCLFSERNMRAPDKKDVTTTKEGSGRVALYKATGLIYSYTLECNYNSGRKTNHLSSATMDNGQASPPQTASLFPHKLSISDYEEVGHGVAIALLDMHQINPWSRLPSAEHSTLSSVRQFLLQRITAARSKKDACKTAGTRRLPITRRPSSISGEGGDSDKEESYSLLTDTSLVKPSLATSLDLDLHKGDLHYPKPHPLIGYQHSTSASSYWFPLSHPMRQFTSDSILLRQHHHQHSLSQSSLPITITSRPQTSSHLYDKNSTSLPNPAPLSTLRQLLASQQSTRLPLPLINMAVSGTRCPTKPLPKKSLPLTQCDRHQIMKKKDTSELKHTDPCEAYWIEIEPQRGSTTFSTGKKIPGSLKKSRKKASSKGHDFQAHSKLLTMQPTANSKFHLSTACNLLTNTRSSRNKPHRSEKVLASKRSGRPTRH